MRRYIRQMQLCYFSIHLFSQQEAILLFGLRGMTPLIQWSHVPVDEIGHIERIRPRPVFHCGSGLLIPQPVGSELELIVNDEACAFEQVTSSGSTLTIHSSALREDSLVTVRYQQQGFCASSLYSSAMLPVRPFTVTL